MIKFLKLLETTFLNKHRKSVFKYKRKIYLTLIYSNSFKNKSRSLPKNLSTQL